MLGHHYSVTLRWLADNPIALAKPQAEYGGSFLCEDIHQFLNIARIDDDKR